MQAEPAWVESLDLIFPDEDFEEEPSNLNHMGFYDSYSGRAKQQFAQLKGARDFLEGGDSSQGSHITAETPSSRSKQSESLSKSSHATSPFASPALKTEPSFQYSNTMSQATQTPYFNPIRQPLGTHENGHGGQPIDMNSFGNQRQITQLGNSGFNHMNTNQDNFGATMYKPPTLEHTIPASNALDLSFVYYDEFYFRESYQRNNKKGGKKHLRCFPCCSTPAHGSNTACQSPLILRVQFQSFNAETTVRGPLFAFAVFELDYEKENNRLDPTMGSSVLTGIAPGDFVNMDLVVKQSKTKTEPLNPVFRGKVLVNDEKRWLNNKKYKRNNLVEKGTVTEQDLHDDDVMFFEFKEKAWHYGWRGARRLKKVFHTLKICLFEEEPQQEATTSPQLLKCVGILKTPEFSIFSSRSAKTKAYNLRVDTPSIPVMTNDPKSRPQLSMPTVSSQTFPESQVYFNPNMQHMHPLAQINFQRPNSTGALDEFLSNFSANKTSSIPSFNQGFLPYPGQLQPMQAYPDFQNGVKRKNDTWVQPTVVKKQREYDGYDHQRLAHTYNPNFARPTSVADSEFVDAPSYNQKLRRKEMHEYHQSTNNIPRTANVTGINTAPPVGSILGKSTEVPLQSVHKGNASGYYEVEPNVTRAEIAEPVNIFHQFTPFRMSLVLFACAFGFFVPFLVALSQRSVLPEPDTYEVPELCYNFSCCLASQFMETYNSCTDMHENDDYFDYCCHKFKKALSSRIEASSLALETETLIATSGTATLLFGTAGLLLFFGRKG